MEVDSDSKSNTIKAIDINVSLMATRSAGHRKNAQPKTMIPTDTFDEKMTDLPRWRIRGAVLGSEASINIGYIWMVMKRMPNRLIHGSHVFQFNGDCSAAFSRVF